MRLRNEKVLITGATGFVGANIAARFLAEGCRVFIFTRVNSDRWRIRDILERISVYSVDLNDETAVLSDIERIEPEIIIHSAVYGGYPFQKDARKMIDTNLIGTMNLLNACGKIGFKLFLNMGSSSEYGIKSNPMNERDLLEPVTDYGVSKASTTLYCQSYAKATKHPVATLRLFSAYGYYEEGSRLIPSAIMWSLKNSALKLSSPHNTRDFIFIDDVLEACIKIIENCDRASGEIFNIGSGRQHTVDDMAKKIIALTGAESVIEYGRANPRLEPKVWQADISKAISILKWKPQHDLDSGLGKTITWFKKNMKLYQPYALR